ncbi:MAG: hypothetical protein ACOX8S_11255 [Christensenellales bacterium]|jgi:phage-related minor tail protein
MDYAFKVSQSTGIGFSDLLSKMQSFGPTLQGVGYSFETASTLIGNLEKQGVNTDEMLSALKKSIATMSKEGIDAADGFAYFYEQIKNTEDATEAAAIAAELFGARAGPDMAKAIKDGTFAIGDFAAELARSGETIGGVAEDTYDLEERMQLFRQNAEVALRPLANTVFDSLNRFIPLVTQSMELMAPAIAELGELFMPLIEDLFSGLLPVLQEILPVIMSLGKNVLSKLIPPFMRIVNAIMPMALKLMDAFLPLLNVAVALLEPIMVLIEGLIVPIIDLISSGLAPLIGVFTTLIDAILTPLMPIITAISEKISGQFADAFKFVIAFVGNIKTHFELLISFVKNVFTGNWEGAWQNIKDILVNLFKGIGNVLATPLNYIIDLVNNMISGLNGITIPDWVPLVGGKSFDIPLIPKIDTFAKGGFTDGLSFAGEAGPEAVLSFDPAYRTQNLSYWARAGQMLGAVDGDILSSSTSNNATTVYQIDGITFSPQITVEGDDDPMKIIEALKEYMPEFYDLIDEYFKRKGAGSYEPEGSWA